MFSVPYQLGFHISPDGALRGRYFQEPTFNYFSRLYYFREIWCYL